MNQELQDEIKRLEQEVEFYKSKCEMLESIIDTHAEKEKAYHKIFTLQEAELDKLRFGD